MANDSFFANQDLGRFLLIENVGNGDSGQVWSAIDKTTREVVALKFFTKASMGSVKDEYAKSLEVEHPNLLRPLSQEMIGDFPTIILPYCIKRSAETIAGHFTESQIWRLLYDISSTLQALHEHSLGHFDVSPSNILINDKNFMLSDFGACHTLTKEETSLESHSFKSDNLSYGFSAPQPNGNIYNAARDIWSLGATVFFLYMGCQIWNGLGGRSQTVSTIIPYMRRELPSLSELIMQCLIFDEKKRPTAKIVQDIAANNILKGTPSILRTPNLRQKDLKNAASKHSIKNVWPEEMIRN